MKYRKAFFSSLLVLTLLLLIINSIFLISINKRYKDFQLASKIRSIVSGKLERANFINVSQNFNNRICSPPSAEASSSIEVDFTPIFIPSRSSAVSLPIIPTSTFGPITSIHSKDTSDGKLFGMRDALNWRSSTSRPRTLGSAALKAPIYSVTETVHVRTGWSILGTTAAAIPAGDALQRSAVKTPATDRRNALRNRTDRHRPEHRGRRRSMVLLYPWSSGRLGNLMFIWASVSAISRRLNALISDYALSSNTNKSKTAAASPIVLIPVLDRTAPITRVFPLEQLDARVVDRHELDTFSASGLSTTRLEESTIMFDEQLVHTLERESTLNRTTRGGSGVSVLNLNEKLVRTFAADGRQREEKLLVDRVFRLIGYFQSWRYFEPHDRTHVCRMFRFPTRVEASALSIAANIRAKAESRRSAASNALPLVLVAVHIRRRDYVHYYGIRVPDMGMIEEAMAYFHDKYLNVWIMCSLYTRTRIIHTVCTWVLVNVYETTID